MAIRTIAVAIRIAVKCSPMSRGGSTALHEKVRRGDTLRIGEPRNLFPLNSERGSVLFLAAGIGITPIFCMANSLARNGGEFAIHYCARSATDAAFYRELQEPSFEGARKFSFLARRSTTPAVDARPRTGYEIL